MLYLDDIVLRRQTVTRTPAARGQRRPEGRLGRIRDTMIEAPKSKENSSFSRAVSGTAESHLGNCYGKILPAIRWLQQSVVNWEGTLRCPVSPVC